MDKLITIYHGSEKNVEQPIFGEGKKNNEFGLGFYCTSSEELAKEWGYLLYVMAFPIVIHWIPNI